MNNSKYVCFYVYWDCNFDGAVCYADVLAPSSSALRLMSCYCEEFTSNCGLRFNASKTQPILNCLPCHIHPVFIFMINNFLFLILSLISVIFFTIYDLSDAPDILDNCVLWLGRLTAYLPLFHELYFVSFISVLIPFSPRFQSLVTVFSLTLQS